MARICLYDEAEYLEKGKETMVVYGDILSSYFQQQALNFQLENLQDDDASEQDIEQTVVDSTTENQQ